MKNTKFRKRALLSSVAMLLVALVALGSATFAWFTDDPNAKATGIKVTANTGLGLVASTTTDSQWSHAAKLYNKATWGDFTLTPATTINGTTYKQAKAASESAPGIKTGEAWGDANVYTANTSDTNVGSGVYHEQIFLKTTSGSANADIKLVGITMTPGTSAHAMNDAVVVLVKYGSTIKEYNLNGTSISKWTGFTGNTVAADDTAKTPDGKSGDSLNEVMFSNVAAETSQTVDVYVYLDGANAQVYTDNATGMNELFSSIELDFTAVAHA